jgi:hypothetical protein
MPQCQPAEGLPLLLRGMAALLPFTVPHFHRLTCGHPLPSIARGNPLRKV